MDTFVDSHCHLADPRIFPNAEALLKQAKQRRITSFLQGGVDPADWDRQSQLSMKFGGVLQCFGVHPYFVTDHSEEQCNEALDQLSRRVKHAWAIGEAGLDFRPHILKDKKDLQMAVFQDQVELAAVAKKPLVLHLVQSHIEALRAFDFWGVPEKKGLVHGFNSSLFYAEKYWSKGFLLSIGGAVCYPKNEKLRNAVSQMPLEFLLVESDSPDQPPPHLKGELNKPTSIWSVAKVIGDLRDMDAEEVLRISRGNFLRLFDQRSLPEC